MAKNTSPPETIVHLDPPIFDADAANETLAIETMLLEDAKAGHKKLLFARYYTKCFNNKQAAIAAGYSEKTAAQAGSRVLKDKHVSRLVELYMLKSMHETEFDANRVLEEAARIALANIKNVAWWNGDNLDLYPSSVLSEKDTAAIESISKTVNAYGYTTVKIKMHNKQPALELLAKYFKLYEEKVIVGADDRLTRLLKEIDQKGNFGLPSGEA